MSSSKNLEYEKTAFLSKSNSSFIEEMYIRFVNNDPDLPESWREYFNEMVHEKSRVTTMEIRSVLRTDFKEITFNENNKTQLN